MAAHQNASNPARAVADVAAERVQEMKSQLSERAAKAMEGLQQAGSEVRAAAHEQLDVLRGTASECYEEGRKRVQQVGQTLEQRIRERPLSSLLIAAGVGCLLGLIWRRR
jgi:ElaB/YqjD/DUF883 family membrane-anchored ribosome-binding protein